MIYSSQYLKWIKKGNQSCHKTRIGIVKNSCITLMKLWWY